MSSMARLVSLSILTVLIVFLGITFYRVIAPFLLPLFVAVIVTILCRPLHRLVLKRVGESRPRLAAGLTTSVVMAMILAPLLVGVLVASLRLPSMAERVLNDESWNRRIEWIEGQLAGQPVEESEVTTDLDQPADVLQEGKSSQHRRSIRVYLREWVQERSLGFAGQTLGVVGAVIASLVGMAMFGIALYYFLVDGPALLEGAQNLIPVQLEYQRRLLDQFDRVVRSVVTATLLASVAQGLLTALALLIVGLVFGSEFLCQFFVIFIIATLASVIPLTGTWLLWMPCAAWLAADGHWFGAIVLSLFGLGVIGTLDNVIRVYVLQGDTRLHPLLAFVSVLGGLHVMGLWGVFVGPIVACSLHALVQIFNEELTELSRARFGEASSTG